MPSSQGGPPKVFRWVGLPRSKPLPSVSQGLGGTTAGTLCTEQTPVPARMPVSPAVTGSGSCGGRRKLTSSTGSRSVLANAFCAGHLCHKPYRRFSESLRQMRGEAPRGQTGSGARVNGPASGCGGPGASQVPGAWGRHAAGEMAGSRCPASIVAVCGPSTARCLSLTCGPQTDVRFAQNRACLRGRPTLKTQTALLRPNL